ncbi:MAG: hypothetical protein AABY18_02250 [Candidatus Thermoplasmatota archaeon]
MPDAYIPGFTLADAPDAIHGDLVQELIHDALRRHPGKVLVYDSAHAFHPDSFAALNRRRGRPEAEHADRCLIQRCITPFQWDALLSKHLDKFLAANLGNVALVVAFPYGRLFATDELADWERVDHLDFSLDHLAKRGATVPIVAVTSLDAIADQPELHRRLAGVQDLVRVRRDKGGWKLHPGHGSTQSPQSHSERADSEVSVGSVPALAQQPTATGNIHLALSKPQVPGWDGLTPMGMSQPTVSNQIDAFQSSFSAFRANLPKREQARFDDIVAWARRHGNALNVSEDLDVTRRILLVAAIALADRHVILSDRHAELEARHAHLAQQVEARLRALEARAGIPVPETDHAQPPAKQDGGLVPLRRLSQRQFEQHGGVGEGAGGHVSPEGPVPA